MKIYFYILTIFLSSSFNITSHETYISIAEIEIKSDRKIEISLDITAHDFEYAYKKENNVTVKPKVQKNSGLEYFDDVVIQNYIEKHFLITQFKDTINLDLIGNEINLEGLLSIYIQGNLNNNTDNLKIYNDLLVDVFPSQQNIVNLKGLKKESFTFNKNIKSHEF